MQPEQVEPRLGEGRMTEALHGTPRGRARSFAPRAIGEEVLEAVGNVVRCGGRTNPAVASMVDELRQTA